MQADLFNICHRDKVVLRPYQEECIQAVSDSFNNNQSCLVVMATGLGKTVTAAEVLKQRGGRSLWVAHRTELIEQAQSTIGRLTGVLPQIEMAHQIASFSLGNNDCVVGSVQTLNAKRKGKKRMHKFNPAYCTTLVTDEAHHATAKSWSAVSEHFCSNEKLRHLGLTATPDRGDEQALGQVYDVCAFRYDIQDGVTDGWLVPLHIQRIYIDEINLSSVSTVAGDLNQGELSYVMEKEKTVFGLADALLSEAGNRQTLVFTSSVKHAYALSDVLNTRKPNSAMAIDGKTHKDERKNTIERFKNKDIQYLCNVGIATEGFDVPGIECVAIARPTKSRALYTQMVGRGTRPLANTVDGIGDAAGRRMSIESSAKPNMLILDFVGNSGRHKLVSAADVLGGNYSTSVVEHANKLAMKEGKAVDTIELLQKAESAVLAKMKRSEERRLRSKVESDTRYRKVSNDPFDILDIEPELSDNEWKNQKPLTPKQTDWLIRSGFEPEALSVPQQRKILNKLINNVKRGIATPKQKRFLNKYGYNTSKMTKDEASALIDRIANNNWRKP